MYRCYLATSLFLIIRGMHLHLVQLYRSSRRHIRPFWSIFWLLPLFFYRESYKNIHHDQMRKLGNTYISVNHNRAGSRPEEVFMERESNNRSYANPVHMCMCVCVCARVLLFYVYEIFLLVLVFSSFSSFFLQVFFCTIETLYTMLKWSSSSWLFLPLLIKIG